MVAVGEMISRTIDFEESDARRRTAVKTGIDPQLDALKRWYDGMDTFLTEVVNRLNQHLPEWARPYIRSCVFLPQLGFLAAVELDPLDDVVVENPSRSMEAENSGRRRLVLRLLMEMAKRSVSSVARMRAVIEGVWQRRDFHLHAAEDRKMGRFADLNDWEVFVVPGSDALSLV